MFYKDFVAFRENDNAIDEALKLKRLDHRNIVKYQNVECGTSLRSWQYAKDKELHKQFRKKYLFVFNT